MKSVLKNIKVKNVKHTPVHKPFKGMGNGTNNSFFTKNYQS